MVRGNWQKRVEKAEARRKEAKEKKQNSTDKRLRKIWVQEFLAKLDSHESTLRKNGRPWVLECWTSTLASNSPPLLDMLNGDDQGKRPRSSSIESEGAIGRKGRGRSNSMGDKATPKKKVHPRSKEAAAERETGVPNMGFASLCRKHFFTGKCDAVANKKCGCRHVHFSKKQSPSLAALVDDREELCEAESALTRQVSEEDELQNPGAMDVLFHCSINIDKVEDEADAISTQCQNMLAKISVPLASVAFVSLNRVLVFDRYRDGTCVSDEQLQSAAMGPDASQSRDRRISIGSESDTPDGNRYLFDLPGNILEHLLKFLPDEAVASAAQVCKSWDREIGKNPSPNLWLHLLERRGWPIPAEEEDEEPPSARSDRYRKKFLGHYSVLRDCSALQRATDAIGKRNVVAETEFCYQDFSRHNGAPHASNSCVAVKCWSSEKVLVAYSPECSLRLFAANASLDSHEVRCKELASMVVDPYRQTKRRSCEMVAMDVDEDFIGCLCYVTADHVDAEAFILVLTSRDEFLVNETKAPSVVDIGEAILNYLLSSEDVDHRLLQLMDYLEDGGEIGDIDVLVSKSIVACGYGRFMIEVAIAIPEITYGIDGVEELETRLLDRKLVLFSASAGAIVWMESSMPVSEDPRPLEEEMVLCAYRPLGSRAVCHVVVSSPLGRFINRVEITSRGEVALFAGSITESGAEGVLSDRKEEWRVKETPSREILLTATDVIVADTLEQVGENDEVLDHQSILSFYKADSGDYSVVVLPGKLSVSSLTAVRDEHVIVIAVGPVEEGQDSGGHWDRRRKVVAIIIHVPSRQEIGRIDFGSGAHLANHLPLLHAGFNTVCLSLSTMGVSLTGSDVRETRSRVVVVGSIEVSKSGRKKKKSSGRRKGGKKDGFARGMSVRG